MRVAARGNRGPSAQLLVRRAAERPRGCVARPGDDVDAAMGRLTTALRDAVPLRVIDEPPYAEIADRLNITPLAARARVSPALCRLRAAAAGHPPELDVVAAFRRQPAELPQPHRRTPTVPASDPRSPRT